ncbi:ribonuclease H-like protein [Rhizobium phage RHph_TM16]|nr:ribonuclease H-like protein [Rhizobium phage RHph_TM16]
MSGINFNDPARITIFADAAFQEYTGAAGWGAWSKRGGWEWGYKFGGTFHHKMPSNNAAELCALANAIHVLHTEDKLDGITRILLQSDSLQALSIIYTAIPTARQFNSAGVTITKMKDPSKLDRLEAPFSTAIAFLKAYAEAGIAFELKHVKGHAKANSGRSWVNGQTDKLAYKGMCSHPLFMKSNEARKRLR